METKNAISRRTAITGMGAVLATAAFTPIMANGLETGEISMSTAPEDPTTKYPRPPFREQSQPWPGLVSKMDPRPDHGEKSYKEPDG